MKLKMIKNNAKTNLKKNEKGQKKRTQRMKNKLKQKGIRNLILRAKALIPN